MTPTPRVVALSGGVGGARLLDGLAQALPPEQLTAIVNTGDDFVHWGLHISPDLDTVMYTLSGLAHKARGWGLAEESFATLEQMKLLGGPDWFQLGDRDLATHLLRTLRLNKGDTLSTITADLCQRLGVQHTVLPMADQRRPTIIDTKPEENATPLGSLTFQDWFVLHRTKPKVRAIRFEGTTEPAPAVLPAIKNADLVIVAPSNPYVSIDPILALNGVRDALTTKTVIAVSPIVAGQAIKGPLADMIVQLSDHPPGPHAIAQHYAGLLSGLVIEHGDENPKIDIPTHATQTIMKTRADRLQLAHDTLAFAQTM